MIKYLICPDYVRSRTDGDRHYISAHQLIHLYKVNPTECIIKSQYDAGYNNKDLIVLSPDYSGQYVVPAE